MPAGARPFTSFDIICIGACRRGCNCHHDFCNAHWVFEHSTSHLSRLLLFLLDNLARTAGPAFYVAIVKNQPGVGRNLALILIIARFIVPVVGIMMPSGRMFGDRLVSKLRKYLASQTFTADRKQKNQWPIFYLYLLLQTRNSEGGEKVHCKNQVADEGGPKMSGPS